MDTGSHQITWNLQLEKIISEEGERSLCYSWLHSKSEKWYSNLNNYISLPVIVMSTLAGAGSIGSQTVFGDSYTGNIVIGSISLFVATLNTISSYFAWAKRSESHRLASNSYGKIYRHILIELALPRKERIAAKDMLKIVREETNRLQEISPQIPDVIISQFHEKFKDVTDIKKPEITNGLDPIYIHPPDIETPIVLQMNGLTSQMKISSVYHTRDNSRRPSVSEPSKSNES